MLSLEEIKKAVKAGQTVHWMSRLYVVTCFEEEFNILCQSNGNLIGLTWRDGTTLNGEPKDFYIATPA